METLFRFTLKMLTLVDTEEAGGLFDFNATLPLMALLIVLLTCVLTCLFYYPTARILEEREKGLRFLVDEVTDQFLAAYILDKLSNYLANYEVRRFSALWNCAIEETQTNAASAVKKAWSAYGYTVQRLREYQRYQDLELGLVTEKIATMRSIQLELINMLLNRFSTNDDTEISTGKEVKDYAIGSSPPLFILNEDLSPAEHHSWRWGYPETMG